MQPGYRKKTKFVPTVRDKTGFVTLNNVVDTIKDLTSSEEFYEIEPAKVLKVYMDDEDSMFPYYYKDGVKIPDRTYLGAITVRLLYSQEEGEYIDEIIRPLSPHIVSYPIRGEIVNIANYNGKLYYFNPLNNYGRVNMNRPKVKDSDNIVLHKYTKYNRPVAPEQGDTVIQGRFGQSIHFGSDDNYVKPYIKFSVGQNNPNLDGVHSMPDINKIQDETYPHKEDINLDESSIFITTNQHVPLQISAKSKTLQENLGGHNRSAIVLNSDCITFNAKDKNGDVSMFAQRNINLSANTQINLETEFGKIFLGDVDSNNGVVKGRELTDFFRELTNYIKYFAKDMNKSNLNAEQQKACDTLVEDLEGLADFYLGDAQPYTSRRVFVTEREYEEQELIDMDSVWGESDWHKIDAYVEPKSKGRTSGPLRTGGEEV